jgi:hypothetical protein
MESLIMSARKVITGKSLIQKYSIPAKRAYFSKTSKIYEVPATFPVALCDLNGYVIFPNPSRLKEGGEFKMGFKLIVFGGLKSLTGYTRFSNPIEV